MADAFSRKEFLHRGAFRLVDLAIDVLRGVSVTEMVGAGNTDAPPPPRARVPRVIPSAGLLRPPGAVEAREFAARCTGCTDCLTACPHFVIRRGGPELGSPFAGTPVLVVQDNPCLMCTGFPCAAACTTGALVMPTGKATIGTAVVNAKTCFLARGQPCDYCQNYCPTKPKAIRCGPRGSVPEVDVSACTGCGQCAQLCPARAIVVEPRLETGGSR